MIILCGQLINRQLKLKKKMRIRTEKLRLCGEMICRFEKRINCFRESRLEGRVTLVMDLKEVQLKPPAFYGSHG